MLALIMLGLNVSVTIAELALEIDNIVWVRLFPGNFVECLFFTVALLGFRWSRHSNGWVFVILVLLLLPFQILSIDMAITDNYAFSLKYNFIILLLSLFAGLRFQRSLTLYLILYLIVTLPLCVYPLMLEEFEGQFELGMMFSWYVNYMEVLFLTIGSALFFKLGYRCQFLLDEREKYLYRLRDIISDRQDSFSRFEEDIRRQKGFYKS